MVSNWRSKTTVAGSTLLLWALVAGSAVYWGLRLGAHPSVLPPPAAAAGPTQVDPLSVASLLGSSPQATPAAPALSSRFALQGVVADGSQGGAAVIAVDGKPPRAYRVGATVDEGLVLQSVSTRGAALGAEGGPASVTLELPRPAQPNRAPSGLPGAPAVPGIPGAPAASGAPLVPGPQVMPGAPGPVPGVPSAPGVPAISGSAGLVPGTPGPGGPAAAR